MITTTLINSTQAQYTDKDFSWLQDKVLTAGYFADQSGNQTFKVVQKGTPSMGVDIEAGSILVPFTKSGKSWKVICETTGETLTVTNNSTGSNRVDAVIIKLDTAVNPNSAKSNVAVAQVIQGTGVSALSDGAIQTAIGATYNFIRLANITVPDSATTILNGNIVHTVSQVTLTKAIKIQAGAIVYTGGELDNYVTQEEVTISSTDQTQTTADGVIEFGEANTTTKKNEIGQSYIPTRTKIRKVDLFKKANTGTFTGTVTVELQADSSGSWSGTALASKTFTNSEYNGLNIGEFECLFSSEYSGLVPDTTYWIVVKSSTADSSNHPNLGVNTAGGYANGSVKYKNTADGHVAVSTIDLYFKTYEGNESQVVKTDETGKIPNQLLDRQYLTDVSRTQWNYFNSATGAGGTHFPIDTHKSNGKILFTKNSNNTTAINIGTPDKFGNYSYNPITVSAWSGMTAKHFSWFADNILIMYQNNSGGTAHGFRIINTSGTVLYESSITAVTIAFSGNQYSTSNMTAVSGDGINGKAYVVASRSASGVSSVFEIDIAGTSAILNNTYSIAYQTNTHSAVKYTYSDFICINQTIYNYKTGASAGTLDFESLALTNYSVAGYRKDPTNLIISAQKSYSTGGGTFNWETVWRLYEIPNGVIL